jgi:hypothetical protein
LPSVIAFLPLARQNTLLGVCRNNNWLAVPLFFDDVFHRTASKTYGVLALCNRLVGRLAAFTETRPAVVR